MSNKLMYVAGGLLSGLGSGMEAQGKAKRDAMLEQLRQEALDRRQERSLAASAAENAKTRAANAGMLSSTVTGQNGEMYGITKAGDVKPLGVKGGSDKNAPSAIREANILVNKGVYPDFKTAYAAVKQRVSMSPQDRRVAALKWVGSQKDQYGNPLYATPEEQAKAMDAYEKFVAGDSTGAVKALKAIKEIKAKGEPAGGSDRAWYQRLYGALFDGTTTDKPATAPSAQPESRPQGGGTRADPYQGTTQDEVDWFKANAQPGDVISINGTLYTKK